MGNHEMVATMASLSSAASIHPACGYGASCCQRSRYFNENGFSASASAARRTLKEYRLFITSIT